MGWSITPTGNVTATTEDGKYKVIFGNRENLPPTEYTIQYKDEEGSSCGKFIVNQEGGGQPAGDCNTPWTREEFSNVNKILSEALLCTGDENITDFSPALCGNEREYEVMTIKIKNKLNGYYIPFSGKVCIKNNYVFARRPTSCDGGLYWYYGSKVEQGFDSNFLIPPGKTATFEGCIRVENNTETEKSYFAFNVLEPFSDHFFHSDNPTLNDESTWGMTIDTATDEQNRKVITFTIDPSRLGIDNWWYGNTRHYALSASDVKNGYVYFDYTTKAKIVPTHLLKIVNGTWNNYPGDSYYPYIIEENT